MELISSYPAHKLEALGQCRYFSNLKNDILNELATCTYLYRFNANEIICWQGDECSGLYIIQHGKVKLFRLSSQGRELIINILGNNDSFNEVPVFDQHPNPINVQALEISDIWLVDKEIIRSLIIKYPEMAQKIILNLTQNLRMLVDKAEELSFDQVTIRLARLLSQISLQQNETMSFIPPTQDQLAAQLGTVREVVARSLKTLERGGAIKVQRRRINILSEDILAAWAQDVTQN
jgi:CRP/FNR family transcriptional regulator